jgi:hypothetical protein
MLSRHLDVGRIAMDKFVAALLNECEVQGMQPPITVCVVSHGGSLFCLRVTGEGHDLEVLCRYPEDPIEPQSPISIFVVDKIGKATHGYVAVDDPASVTLDDARSRTFRN